MALKILQPGTQPLGQFDGLDSELTSFKGGEVVTLVGVVNTVATDKASSDVFDGYTGTTTKRRPAVTKTLVSGSRPLFLCDDGTSGYGTLFGSVVGGSVGLTVTGGAVLGPHTATGSGKITLWDKPGLYAVTLDAVDTAADGIVPSNNSMTVGIGLTYTTGGLLTPVGSTAAVGSAPVVARFVEFNTDGSLVTTPNSLVAALNSPSGDVSSAAQRAFTVATFWYAGAHAGA